MSKAELKPKARELYVIHQLSLADISRRLNISTRTLQNWKSDDHWDLERSNISGSENNFHGELFQLGEILARKIKEDIENGIEIEPQRYAALQRIIDTAETSRKYEEKAPKKSKDEKSPEERQKAALAKMKEIFGICEQA